MSRRVLLLVVAAGSVCCARPAPPPTGPTGSLAQDPLPTIPFLHDNGARGDLHIVELLAPGGAAVDVDGDGDLDLILRQGSPIDDPTAGPGDVLLLNQLIRPAGEGMPWAFVDASEDSGLDVGSYGIGISVGDVDGDGLVDLYLANYGPDRLLRSRGDGTFEDVTIAAGLLDPDPRRITGASTFFDCDGDADLDLYVGGYVELGAAEPRCTTPLGRPDYCGPLSFGPTPGRLFVNDGGGRFTERSRESGIAAGWANALGATAHDFDGDGLVDLFVASDATANQLWINQGACRFVDEATLRGVGLNAGGLRTGDMGVALGDLDRDGDLDLVSTHIAGEMHSVWIDLGGGQFDDRAIPLGVGRATATATGFGVAFLDVENDGLLDLVVANGAVRIRDDRAHLGTTAALQQPSQLLSNRDGAFVDVSDRGGAVITEEAVGRGIVVADFDNDGDEDAVLLRNMGVPGVFRSRASELGNWLGLRLVSASGAPAIGALLTLSEAAGSVRRVHTDGSYASARDDRVLFGLGPRTEPVQVEVRWPDGSIQTLGPLSLGRYHEIRATP